jgi:hypothetical protein
MLKIILSLFFVGLFYTCGFTQNLFEKGSHHFDFNLALGLNKITTQLLENSSNNNALTINIPVLAYEYSLLNEIGIGLQFKKGNFFFTANPEYLTTNSLLIINNLHFIRKTNFDFFTGAAYGISGYKTLNSERKYSSSGLGMAFELYLASRIQFKEKFTFNIKVVYNDEIYKMTRYSLNNMEYQSTKNVANYIYLKGMNVFFGISYQFERLGSKN